MNNYLILYSSVVITRGVKRSVILDLEREIFFYIPNALSEIIELCYNTDLSTVLEAHGNSKILDDYIEFLIKHDLAFIGTNPEYYPKMSNDYFPLGNVDNCIIDWENDINYDIFKLLRLLDAIHCKHIQLRFYEHIDIQNLRKILDEIQSREFSSVEIFYKFGDESIKDFKGLLEDYTKIKILFIHGFNKTKAIKIDPKLQHSSNMGAFFVSEERLASSNQCGIIDPSYFVINRNTYNEALNFNSCLYGKIGIDQRGYIKNCPSMTKHYGHIDEIVALDSILQSNAFSKLGLISKDEISECKICEHRYICTDCRAFQSEEVSFNKPAKCNYNPYEATWENPI